jgi:hypothetical protein
MELIEKRVLGEVQRGFTAYWATHSAFPWLSPFTDPTASAFRALTTTKEGHIPFHWSSDPSTFPDVNPFPSSVGWRWNIDSGTGTFSDNPSLYLDTITDDCLENLDCTDPLFPTMSTAIAWSPATVLCSWLDKNTADCGIAMALNGPITCDLGCGWFNCVRLYQVTFPSYTGVVTINDPTSTTFRTRDVTLSGNIPTQAVAIVIADVYIGDDPATGCFSTITVVNHIRGISFISGTTTGMISTLGIQYDIDVDDIELPEWFVKNKWHELVYIAYPPVTAEPVPGGATACTAGIDCITLNIGSNPHNDIRALAIIAGKEDPGSDTQTRPSSSLSDYFEDENNSPGDDTFEKLAISSSYNDQVRIIAP